MMLESVFFNDLLDSFPSSVVDLFDLREIFVRVVEDEPCLERFFVSDFTGISVLENDECNEKEEMDNVSTYAVTFDFDRSIN